MNAHHAERFYGRIWPGFSFDKPGIIQNPKARINMDNIENVILGSVTRLPDITLNEASAITESSRARTEILAPEIQATVNLLHEKLKAQKLCIVPLDFVESALDFMLLLYNHPAGDEIPKSDIYPHLAKMRECLATRMSERMAEG